MVSGRLVRRDNPTVQIAGTVKLFARITTIGGGRIDANGRVDFDLSGDTTLRCDQMHRTQRVFLDQYGREVLETNVAVMLDSGSLVLPFRRGQQS